MTGICRLCGEVRELQNSHVIPAFVVRWIKETSATPYLRSAESPNLRKQDIGTTKLLCKECEGRFSYYEDLFARKIFNPYVGEELDQKGCGGGHIKEFEYGDWLLKFAISLQWRMLATRPNKVEDEIELCRVELIWRQFLLKKRCDTGVWENHIIFLSSLAGAKIPSGLTLGRRVNMYLLHSVDGTTVSSDNNRHLGVYSKIGPIAFYAAIKPNAVKGNTDSKLHMRGIVKTSQKLCNGWLNQFIFVTRPNEGYREISDTQLKKLNVDMSAHSERVLRSMSPHLLKADFELKRKTGG